MSTPGRIYSLHSSGAFLLLTPLFILLLFASFIFQDKAEGKTIIVDENHPPKTRSTKSLTNTRIICINNSPSEGERQTTEDNICPSLGGYYCKSLGRQAWLRVDYPTALDEDGPTTSFYLGRIVGVTWRDSGQPVGMYLAARPDFSRPLSAYLRSNVPSPSDTFYLIIETGTESTMLVEPHRIIIRE